MSNSISVSLTFLKIKGMDFCSALPAILQSGQSLQKLINTDMKDTRAVVWECLQLMTQGRTQPFFGTIIYFSSLESLVF